jgi:hypothetical protein
MWTVSYLHLPCLASFTVILNSYSAPLLSLVYNLISTYASLVLTFNTTNAYSSAIKGNTSVISTS